MTELLLGIDIGTSSTKGVLCTPDGQVVGETVIEHGVDNPRPGWWEQDADAVWWGDVVRACQQLLSGADGEVKGVAISAIGPCLLPVDADGRPLRKGILYGIDARAGAEIDWLNDHFGEDAMYDLASMTLTSQAMGPKILWIRNHEPEIYERTATFLTASSYVVLRLTGERVMDTHTASYYNPLIDLRAGRWDERFAGPITDLDRLPRIAPASELAGTVTAAASEETGLPVGTPVTIGTIDAAAEAISVGVTEPGDMVVMYGTTLFFIQQTAAPYADRRMWSAHYVLPGTFGISGGLSAAGALTRWGRDTLGGPELAAERAGGPNAYAALGDLAASVPAGSGGLVCLPFFAGERTPINDPDARGMYAGLSLNHSRAHLYRAALEGTAYGVRHNLETMAAMGSAPKRLVAVGGGARNRTWLQVVSDVTGVPQDVPERTTGAAFGDAFLAGLATGLIPDLKALRGQWVTIAEELRPDPASREIYDTLYPIYRDLYENTRDQLHALAAIQVTAGMGTA
ncbi:MAG TPA: FGGY-family carbohydrate kinase [Thermomicrobiales bacterium]|nr:FGGY-family carbohydrate kinase [Thermomicrobiales bacterium]